MTEIFEQLLGAPPTADRYYGVCVGIVTNNQDPEGLGRVKVRFPWLSDKDESTWARVATFMAGPQRGAYFLPEVEDEVLVAFEYGVVERPYVLGALWNGQDKPPADNADGKNNVRVIRSRSGHTIRLDDTEGKEQIEISDKSGKNRIVVDSKRNTISISAEADVSVQFSNGKLSLNGRDVEVKSSGNMTLQAGGQMVIKGATVNIN